MNVVYHSSDSFVPVLGVSIVSLLINNKDIDSITFYVIENKITTEHKIILEKMLESYPNARIVFIPMPDMNQDFNLGLKQIKSIWLFDSYCRLFLGTILPESVERVLYLDCDTLCTDSLQDFYNIDFEGNLCAGVSDCLGENYYNLFGMNRTSFYCNSGMVLFDLQAWRKQNMESVISNYVKEKNGYVFFMEQSVLSILLQDKIKIVHPRYNTYTLMISLSYDNLYKLRHCERFYTKQQICEAIEKPAIIHLTNSFYVKGRPWIKGNSHPFKDLFMMYRSVTPWKEEPLFEDKTPFMKKMFFSFVRNLPQSFVCSCVGKVYNNWRPRHIAKKQAMLDKHEE